MKGPMVLGDRDEPFFHYVYVVGLFGTYLSFTAAKLEHMDFWVSLKVCACLPLNMPLCAHIFSDEGLA